MAWPGRDAGSITHRHGVLDDKGDLSSDKLPPKVLSCLPRKGLRRLSILAGVWAAAKTRCYDSREGEHLLGWRAARWATADDDGVSGEHLRCVCVCVCVRVRVCIGEWRE